VAQFGRPASDTTNVGYTSSNADGTSSLFAFLNESTASDTSYVKSALAPSQDPYVTKLSLLTDPTSSSGHVLRYRVSKDTSGGEQIDMTMQLRQGYTDEGTLGTLIAEWPHVNVGSTFSTSVRTLTASEADSITSYGGLYVRSVATQIIPFVGTTFFTANAESGAMTPPWESWGVISDGVGNSPPTNSTTTFKNGSRAFRYEIVAPTLEGHYSQTLSGGPQFSMGSPNGKYLSGYWSWWMLIDDGWEAGDSWNMTLGWMTGTPAAPDPICHFGIQRPEAGVLQWIFYLKNAAVGNYTPPEITGYSNENGEYQMTVDSPNGITEMPRGEWVHICARIVMAATDGRVSLWQNGVLIMDLTHATMNTIDGHTNFNNTTDDMIFQFGIYGGTRNDGTQLMYVDDFKVTDWQVTP
jgi:hypothetical protein